MNPFVMLEDWYQRNLDIFPAYIEQVATYLHKRTGRDLDQCKAYVKKQMAKGGKFQLNDPAAMVLAQRTEGNRVKEVNSFLGYIHEVIDSGRIVSPSMVIYERPEVKRSGSAEWVEGGIQSRKKSKKEMFVYKQAGNGEMSYLKDCEQNAKKIGINSVSGMHGFTGNALYIRSGHSSLTSMCRTASGYGNASNERFLSGSRHYHTPEIARANILAMITTTKRDRFQLAMDKYRLYVPTVQDCMEWLDRSIRKYWRNEHQRHDLQLLIESLDEQERAIIVYSGDMYHFAKHNPKVMRAFFDNIVKADVSQITIEDPAAYLKTLGATDVAMVNALCAELLRGKTHEQLQRDDPVGYMVLAKTAKAFLTNLSEFADLIQGLWVPDHLPPTVANLRDIQRECSLLSDTDSTIFTVQDWVQWYTGTLDRSEDGDKIWYLTTYMACQCIVHVLAQFSANMGVERKFIHRLAMKNEYAFPVFSLTNLAKHYYAFISMREGNVYDKYDTEVKGVELRGSAAPPHVMDNAKQLMQRLLTHVDRSEQISARALLEEIAGYEQETIDSIRRGEFKYLRSDSIKPDTVKTIHYDLWETVFAPKYGAAPPPPYPAIKLSTELANKTKVREWIDSIADKDLAARLEGWFERTGRKDLNVVLLPALTIRGCGIPDELMLAANVRKLTYEINSVYYRILESTGLHIVDRNYHRLVTDYLRQLPEAA